MSTTHGLAIHDLIPIEIQREPWFQDLMAESFPGWKGNAGHDHAARIYARHARGDRFLSDRLFPTPSRSGRNRFD
ncbi:hypothetical protein [Frigidibacter sp. SD6-1]|uniref:hypothetical protein n=1 Tax=Frigidibacter sp. SD6-1 TaxID=3032581 RepID=UPI0024DF741C|nr:hypothetical protein [Frigidibacter sp. SD6-1]